MSRSSLVLFILFEQSRITTELTWNTKTTSYSLCHGKNQSLLWDFTEKAGEKILELQWFFKETTLICLALKNIEFHVEPLYHGKIERIGKAGILFKNISLNDAGKYTLYVKLAEEKERNMQHIFLDVYESVPSQCKPVIKNVSTDVLHCSTNCSVRSQLSPEWIINSTQGPKGIGSYLTFDVGTKEQAFCCMKCHDYDDDRYNFCMPNPFFSKDFNDVAKRGPNENNQVKATNFESLEIVSVTVCMICMVCIVIAVTVKLKRRFWTRCVKSKLSKDVSKRLNGVDHVAGSAVAVKPQMLDKSHKCTEDHDAADIVAGTTDASLTHSHSRQNIQIVNHVMMDAEFLKSIFDSERNLFMHFEAVRQENKKLKLELQYLKHFKYSGQKELEASQESSGMKQVTVDLYNRSDTDESETTSVYEDSLSEPFMQKMTGTLRSLTTI